VTEPIKVTLLGESFTLSTDLDREHLERVVELVEEKAGEVKSSLKSSTQLGVAIVTAINIASEFLKVQGSVDDLRGRISVKLAEIDEVLGKLDDMDPATREDLRRVRQQMDKMTGVYDT
jgi:cell division protein ZapA (FtsZ GTPase activity inhibitor)